MYQEKNKVLHYHHVIFLVQNGIVGMGLLSLPHELSSVRYGIWMFPFLYGLIIQILLLLNIRLSRRYPELSFFEITKKVLGKWIGYFVNIIYLLFFLSVMLEVSRGYVKLLQVNTLNNFTITKLLIGLFAVVLYMGRKEINVIAKFCIFSFFSTVWMLLFLQWSLFNGQFNHLMPIFDFNLSELYQALSSSYLSFLGFELLLIYYPYIVYKKKVLKYSSIGLWITLVSYFLVCLACAVYFNIWQLDNLLYPTLSLYKAVELSFIERIENLGLTLWVFLVLSTILVYLWAFREGVRFSLPLKRVNKVVPYMTVLLLFALIIFRTSFTNQEEIFQKTNRVLALTVIAIPLILLCVDTLKKKVAK